MLLRQTNNGRLTKCKHNLHVIFSCHNLDYLLCGISIP